MARSLLMKSPLLLSGTKVRTACILLAAVLQCQSVTAFDGDATGTTMLTPFGRLSAPAVADSSFIAAFRISPAPFGLLELTEAAVCGRLPSADLVMGLFGRSGGGWRELLAAASQRWAVTSTFFVGTGLRVQWIGAAGFENYVGASATVQVLTYLSDEWTLSASADDLLSIGTWRDRPPGSFRLGVGWSGIARTSANLRIVPGRSTSLELAALYELVDGIQVGGGLGTEPLATSLGTRLSTDALWPIAIQLEYAHNVGIRSIITVEVP